VNLANIRGALRTVINSTDGIAANITNGESQSAYFPEIVGPGTTGAKATFEIIAEVPIDTDEVFEEYDEDAVIAGDLYEPDPEDPEARLGAIVQTVSGQRRLTVSIKVECFDQSDSGTALKYLKRIRTRLRLPSSRAVLEAAGAFIQDIGPSRDLSHDDDTDGRMLRVSVQQFDLFLNCTDTESDAPVTTIEQVSLELNEDDPVLITLPPP
jgi:hypothetical protein